MVKSNNIKRSETWNKIYEILTKLPLEEVSDVSMDRPSAATEIEQIFENTTEKEKAMNW